MTVQITIIIVKKTFIRLQLSSDTSILFSFSMAFQMRGVVEADFYYFKSGATITSQFQSASPTTYSLSVNPSTREFSARLDMKNLVSILSHLMNILYYKFRN